MSVGTPRLGLASDARFAGCRRSWVSVAKPEVPGLLRFEIGVLGFVLSPVPKSEGPGAPANLLAFASPSP
jgi:hypothetical protein